MQIMITISKQYLVAPKICGTFLLNFFVNNKPKLEIYTKPINFVLEEIER